MASRRFGPFRRLFERDASRNALLAEAAAELLRAWFVVRFLPFRFAVISGSCVLGSANAKQSIDQLVWAVSVASVHVPWRTVCFQQGLALQRMLRRRGVDALLHYGIGHSDSGEIEAHVWVSVADTILLGGEQAPNFKCVATYPTAATA